MFASLSKTLTSEQCGFKAWKIDPCLFVCNGCIFLVYTDDCIILGINQATIDKLKNSLTEVDSFLHWTKGTLINFLGVCMHMHTFATGNRRL
jgi:hypothetical protein